MNIGEGAVIIMPNKEKLNVKISTEGELAGVDDAFEKVIWTKIFIEGQRSTVEHNTMYQDNRSTMLLKKMVGFKWKDNQNQQQGKILHG